MQEGRKNLLVEVWKENERHFKADVGKKMKGMSRQMCNIIHYKTVANLAFIVVLN